MEFEVFELERSRGSRLTERFYNGTWIMEFYQDGKTQYLKMYSFKELAVQENRNLWNGHRLEEVLDSGRDILAEELFMEGEPSYEKVKTLLPPVRTLAYTFLSGAVSWGGVLVDVERGNIYPQSGGSHEEPSPLFAPVEEDCLLGARRPRQFLVDGQLPMLISVHSNEKSVLEFLYFVEPGDPDRDPVVWIRTKRYCLSAPKEYTISYRIAALSRPIARRHIHKNTFLTALADTAAFWLKFRQRGAQIHIPVKELECVVNGTQMFCATTFSGDHAHYGHKNYGEGVHDNFPPNYTWTLEMCMLYGRISWAKRIWYHLLSYLLTDEGRFVYKQGEDELPGASAAEYGQLLFWANRYRSQIDVTGWEDIWEKLIGLGQVLLDNCGKYEEAGGRVLILMCAEADTNTRIHAYMNNNLWGIRGLRALSELLSWSGRAEQAKVFNEMSVILQKNVEAVLREYSIVDERVGELPPFRIGYTAAPATLSACRDTFFPMSEEEKNAYLVESYVRGPGRDQDLTENTYANYRYYPEMLSSMLLKQEQAEAIVKLREMIGGELLGMTRLVRRIDDWPVLHYARYLLEGERIQKYLLLLYAHTCHHGNPELMCYYEQVTADGKVAAADCVPSLLTVPIMVAWMFAYENMKDGKLSLLKGIPLDWFEKGFSAKGIGYSKGSVDMEGKDSHVRVGFSSPIAENVELVWRKKERITEEDILCGMEFTEKVVDNRIILKRGITYAEYHIKNG